MFDPVAAYRLEEPLTYWNALGVFAAMGALLALGFAARSQSVVARALPAATLPILFSTLYFTFSRGALDRGRRRPGRRRRGRPAPAPAARERARPRRALGDRRLDLLAREGADEARHAARGRLARRASTRGLDPARSRSLSGLAGAGLWLAERRVAPPRTRRLAFGGSARGRRARRGARRASSATAGRSSSCERATTRSRRRRTRPTPNLNQRLFIVLGQPPVRAVARRVARLHVPSGARVRARVVRGVLEPAPPDPAQGPRRAQPLPRGARRARPARAPPARPGARSAARRRSPRAAPSARPAHARGLRRLPRPRRRGLGLGDAGGDARGPRVRRRAPRLRRRPRRACSSRRGRAPPARSPRSLLAVVAFVGVVGASALAASDRALAKGSYDGRGLPGEEGRPLVALVAAAVAAARRHRQRAGRRRRRPRLLPEGALEGRRGTGSSGTTSRRSRPGRSRAAPSRGRSSSTGSRRSDFEERQCFGLTRSPTRSR